MSFSFISFLIAMVVFSGLIILMMKQKAKPARWAYRTTVDSSQPEDNRFNEGLVYAKWAEITTMQNAGPSGLKNALLEADKLLDYCMIGKGFTGDTMGDRLKNGGSRFSNPSAVWSAHKLRNQLAHEVEHDIVPDQIKHAIQNLGNAIRELGVTI